MRTRPARLAVAVLLSLLAFPARADSGAPAVPAQESKDLCSYLKDVDAKTDAACAPDAILALKAQDPKGFAEKLALAAKRKADVQRAYERLKASSAKDVPDLPRLEPPINARTFPAWLGDKALDLKPVYARLLEAQNRQLEKQKAAEASPEKKAEIEHALSFNQAKLDSLQKIKDPSQLSCFLGDTCGNRGDVTGPGGQIVGGSRGAWTQADYEKANAAINRETAVPGGKIGSEVPGPAKVADPADGKSASKNGSPLLPITIPLGLGLVGYGVYRSRKEDGAPQETVPAGSVYKPTLSSDPVGVIADYAFRAKITIEDHPLATLGTVAVVAIGGLYFGGPMLMGAGGGGVAGMAPLAATDGIAPTAGGATAEFGSAGVLSDATKGLARIGGTVAVSKDAWDHISLAKTDASRSGDEDGGEKPTIQSRLNDAKLPSEGDFKFEPPDKYRPGNELPREPDSRGYRDRYGNIWQRGPYHGKPGPNAPSFEWDVQLSEKGERMWGRFAKGKGYINVGPDGLLSH